MRYPPGLLSPHSFPWPPYRPCRFGPTATIITTTKQSKRAHPRVREEGEEGGSGEGEQLADHKHTHHIQTNQRNRYGLGIPMNRTTTDPTNKYAEKGAGELYRNTHYPGTGEEVGGGGVCSVRCFYPVLPRKRGIKKDTLRHKLGYTLFCILAEIRSQPYLILAKIEPGWRSS